MDKYKKPNGVVISINGDPDTVKKALALGWEKITHEPAQPKSKDLDTAKGGVKGGITS